METNSPSSTLKKRSLPGTPDPDSDVIALSPKTLLATNRFVCEICGKGFQRDQNLQLHRRGHNLPWKLRQRTDKQVRKRVYVCPDPACVHHHPSRALGDLTGIKKHFCRKHGEKKHNCDRCSKKYAVHSDWKAHMKTCGTKDYRCDCGALFSRRDSFTTHRTFCNALSPPPAGTASNPPPPTTISLSLSSSPSSSIFPLSTPQNTSLSATALLQKATQIGTISSDLHRLWSPLSSPLDNNISTMASATTSHGLKLENSSMASGFSNELTMSSSDFFCDKPATLDFLGLGMEGEFKTADAWDDASERKPSSL